MSHLFKFHYEYFSSCKLKILLVGLAMLAGMSQAVFGQDLNPSIQFYVGDPGAKSDQRLAPEIGDSLSIGLQGMPRGEPLEIRLLDDKGVEWSGARVNADGRGIVAPFMLWYHSGVIGKRPSGIKIEFEPKNAFRTFEEAEDYFSNRGLRVIVSSIKGRIFLERKFELNKPNRPTVFSSDAKGILMNSMHVEEDRMYVSGRNFKPGEKLSVAVVRNQHRWIKGDLVSEVEVNKAGRFTIPVWDNQRKLPGNYDIIVRRGDDFRDPVLRADDIVSYDDDTATVLFAIINGNIVIDISGRDIPHPGKFEFNDSFEKGEDVWGGVDATDVPAAHAGGLIMSNQAIGMEQALR